MRNLKPGIVFVASVLMAALAFDALAQTEARYAELPNFHVVNSQIYRGAQPKAGGLQTLKKIGIKTILNLRGKDENTRAEEAEARALGLRYYNVPLPEFSAPKDEKVQQVLDLINAVENQPVFVHCRHGEDRTGTIIACYRITHDGWSAAEAKKEAEKLGMSWTQLGMKRYIDKFFRQRQKRSISVPSSSFSLPLAMRSVPGAVRLGLKLKTARYRQDETRWLPAPGTDLMANLKAEF